MFRVFDTKGKRCAGQWEYAGLRMGQSFVRAVIRNAAGSPQQEYAYDEQGLMCKIREIQVTLLIGMGENAHDDMQKLSALTTALRDIKEYKLGNVVSYGQDDRIAQCVA